MATTLNAARRPKIGTRYARRLRSAGQLPAVVYGHGETPESIILPAHDTVVELKHGARMLQVELDGQPTQYLVKAVQYDHLGTTPIHLDLMRVDLTEMVTVDVGIELRGTPKGVADGGVLEQLLGHLTVRCLVTQIPDTLRPSVTHLGVGDALNVGDLKLPEGVTTEADPGERVAFVRVLAEEAAVEAAPTEEVAQPEVIGRPKKEEVPEGE